MWRIVVNNENRNPFLRIGHSRGSISGKIVCLKCKSLLDISKYLELEGEVVYYLEN